MTDGVPELELPLANKCVSMFTADVNCLSFYVVL